MKKCFILAFVLVSLIANAQIEEKKEIVKPTTKGNILLGGFVNFNKVNKTSSYDISGYVSEISEKEYNFNINPNFGYFISDGLAIGAGLPIGYSSSKGDYDLESTSFSYGLSPFLKYYFDFGLFIEGQGAFQMINGTSKSKSSDLDFDGNSKSLDLGVGYAFFINSKVSIEPKLIYRWGKDKVNYEVFDSPGYYNPSTSYGGSYGGYGGYGYSDYANQEPEKQERIDKEDGLFFYIGFQIFL